MAPGSSGEPLRMIRAAPIFLRPLARMPYFRLIHERGIPLGKGRPTTIEKSGAPSALVKDAPA